MKWSDVLDEVTCPACLVKAAELEVEARKAAGWTKADFAAGLKQMLESEHGDHETTQAVPSLPASPTGL